MAGFSIRLDNAVMKQQLQGIYNRGQDLTPAMKSFGEYMRGKTEERFSSERDPDGNPWKPSKTARKEGRKVLTKTHRLRRSVTYVAGRSSLALGTGVVYGRIHQLGGTVRHPARTRRMNFRTYKSGRLKGRTVFAKESRAQFGMSAQGRAYDIVIPARPYLGFSAADVAEAVATVKAYLLEGRS